MQNKLMEIYEALNNEKYTSFYKLNIELKKKLRDIIYDLENPEDIRNAASLEDCVLQFQLAVNELNDFDMKSLPFKAIDNNNIEYFENRIKQVTNPFMLARYYHILWLVKRHNNYAIEAIRNYFKAKEIVVKQKDTNKEWTFDLLECLKRAFLIKRKIKNEADIFNIEKEIIVAITNYLEDEWGLGLCIRLLDIILASHRYFKDLLSNNFLNDINQYAYKLIIRKESFHAIRILNIIIRIAEKMNFNTTVMYENLGIANEARIMDFNKSNGSITYCLEAIKIYSKLKRKNKVNELKLIYEEISGNMKFGMVKTEIDIKSQIDKTNIIIAQLKRFPINDIMQFLIYDKLFIPSKDFILSQAREKKEGFLSSFFNGNYDIYDQRGNLVKICSTEEDKIWYKAIQMYNWAMQFKVVSLNLTLKELIMAEKISFDEIYNDMINNTWLSRIFKYSINNGQETKYTYSNILHTLFKEYFRIFNEYLSLKTLPCTEFMMFIDSASLKIEGLIRELFTLNNYPTIIFDNNTGTTQEKDLNALLHDEKINTFLDEDEVLFFKYLFVEQGGLNLRNRIAHSLLLEQEYNMGFANMIFLALLRLFKFSIKNN